MTTKRRTAKSNGSALEDPDEWVDLSTAARIAGISRQAVAQHTERGHLESTTFAGKRILRVEEVSKLITEFALSGRRPKVAELVQQRTDKIAGIQETADEIIRGFIQVFRSRDADLSQVKSTYKETYKEAIEEISSLPDKDREKETDRLKHSLRSKRDKEVSEIKKKYQKRIEKLHSDRRKMLQA
jgi:antitoxin component HigA of HigAB toxin-antitoxin module